MNEQTQNLLTLLREVPLFSGLSLEEMERLSEEFVMVELPKGENLYQRGEETDGLFVVSSGQIELLDEYGKPLEVLKRAETLGMEALNYVPLRQETATALTYASAFFLPNRQVRILYAEVPAFRETASVLFNSRRLASNIPMI